LNNLSAKAKADRMMAADRGSGVFIPKGLELKKFANCTVRDPKLADLYLVEGDSAGSGLKNGRKIDQTIGGIAQAILPLRGKILNVKDSDVTRALQNKEISTIFTILGVGIGNNNCLVSEGARTYEEEEAALDKWLRFHKVVICTDGDADGSHIQNLLLYLFSKFAPFLITHGKVYIGKAPLYYQNGNYFYPGDPLQPGTTFPVGYDPTKPGSRWKGLGSIPKEQVYDSFFNPATRKLIRVTPEGMQDAMKLIEDAKVRKKFLTDRGIITNPFGV
jgi:DNA gyrase subunit B